MKQTCGHAIISNGICDSCGEKIALPDPIIERYLPKNIWCEDHAMGAGEWCVKCYKKEKENRLKRNAAREEREAMT